MSSSGSLKKKPKCRHHQTRPRSLRREIIRYLLHGLVRQSTTKKTARDAEQQWMEISRAGHCEIHSSGDALHGDCSPSQNHVHSLSGSQSRLRPTLDAQTRPSSATAIPCLPTLVASPGQMTWELESSLGMDTSINGGVTFVVRYFSLFIHFCAIVWRSSCRTLNMQKTPRDLWLRHS